MQDDLATSLQVTLLDWTDPKSLASKSDQDLFDAIRKGKDKMPAEDATRAKNDDVWDGELPPPILKNDLLPLPGRRSATTPAPAADAPQPRPLLLLPRRTQNASRHEALLVHGHR